LTAEPTPDLLVRTADMISVVDGAVVCPMPSPMRISAPIRTRMDVPGLAVANTPRPVAVNSSPEPTTARGPNRDTIRADMGAPTIINRPIGSWATAVLSGAYPFASSRY